MSQKNNKCSKTISGRHHWSKYKWILPIDCSNNGVPLPPYKIKRNQPKCICCGMIDDTKQL